jgi:hypothetical protein
LITLEGSLEDYGRERERGVAREKEERNSFSQNLEKERARKNKYFGSKHAYILLTCEYPKCPSS